MNHTRLIMAALVLISGTVLVALGKISGETWGGMLVGFLLPSPLDKEKKRTTSSGGLQFLALAFCLLLGSCSLKGPEVSWGVHPASTPAIQVMAIPQPMASPAAITPVIAPITPLILQPMAGTLTDTVVFNPQASPSCPSGKACIYAKTADNLFYTKDAAGLELKLHASQSFRTSTNCAGLSSPTAGDVCYDTTLSTFRFFGSTWTSGAIDGSLYVAKAGTETITGAKTFSATTTFSGAVVAAGIGPTSGQQHTLPGVSSDTVALLAATQTFTNKTLTAPVLGGTVTGTYTIGGTPTISAATLSADLNANSHKITNVTNPTNPQDAATKSYVDTPAVATANYVLAGPTTGAPATASYRALVPADVPAAVWASPGAIGSTAPSTGAFTSVTIAGAPSEPVVHRVCTLTSAAAATPVVCLTDGDVPATKKAFLFQFTAKVNGAVAWGTVVTCTIEDTSGNAFVTIPVSSLGANAYLGNWSGGLTLDDRLTLSSGGTADKGLQVKCDANGTGSDLVFTLVSVVK